MKKPSLQYVRVLRDIRSWLLASALALGVIVAQADLSKFATGTLPVSGGGIAAPISKKAVCSSSSCPSPTSPLSLVVSARSSCCAATASEVETNLSLINGFLNGIHMPVGVLEGAPAGFREISDAATRRKRSAM